MEEEEKDGDKNVFEQFSDFLFRGMSMNQKENKGYKTTREKESKPTFLEFISDGLSLK